MGDRLHSNHNNHFTFPVLGSERIEVPFTVETFRTFGVYTGLAVFWFVAGVVEGQPFSARSHGKPLGNTEET